MNPNWTRPYPPREELLKYICDVADKYDVRKYFRFNKAVTRGEWDDAKGVWRVYYKDLSKLPEHSVAEDSNDSVELPK
jgi:cation diffusion facilitator CzcD-associated flavoprotein CzcO